MSGRLDAPAHGRAALAARFARLHRPGRPLLMPNAWDAGSARLLESMGFAAVATTSSGFAATLGRLDGSVSREEALEHAGAIVRAVHVPVSADLESCFASDAEGVAQTARGAVAAGLAGFSIEDHTGDPRDPIYPLEVAAGRVAAAVAVAHDAPVPLVVTARAENHLHGREDLDDTIARLRAYRRAGADVLYAPGPTDPRQIAAIVAAVDAPVNVLVRAGSPTVAELAKLGVARISVGGGFAFAALAAAERAARELRDHGTQSWTEAASAGSRAARAAFARSAER
ncbi:MAG TPA: isocitrate lyase/phosphoenolpyruvate mutase family protein [Solirubrobacteraceae bacterium]|nr:isocitrate lyase/phosphoenolpyruvate mutase family protein [Solirubrobacteraceae bacterium]